MSSATTEATAQSVPTAASPAQAARDLRHQRARKLVKGLIVWVAVPTLLAAFYLGFIASDQYESVASLALRGPGAAADAAMLREFVASRAALARLDVGGKLRTHYQESGDPLSRLARSARSEAVYGYYRGKVETSYDAPAGVLSVRLRAFSGRTAQQYTERLIQASEELLHGMSERTVGARVESAERSLEQAKSELLRVQSELSALEVLGTAATAEQRTQLETKRLERELARQAYDAARDSVKSARGERAKQTQVQLVAAPSLPDEATYPRRIYGTLTVFFAALALFGIGKLLVGAVREHAQF